MCPEINVDLSQVEDFAPIPDGVYPARVVDSKVKTGKDSGKTFVEWTFELFNCENSAFNSRRVWDNTMVEEKAAFRLKNLVKATTGESQIPKQWNTDALHGREVLLTLATETKGEYTNVRVKAYQPLTQ